MSEATISQTITIRTNGGSDQVVNLTPGTVKTLAEVLDEGGVNRERLNSKGVYWTDQTGRRLNDGSIVEPGSILMAVSSHANG